MLNWPLVDEEPSFIYCKLPSELASMLQLLLVGMLPPTSTKLVEVVVMVFGDIEMEARLCHSGGRVPQTASWYWKGCGGWGAGYPKQGSRHKELGGWQGDRIELRKSKLWCCKHEYNVLQYLLLMCSKGKESKVWKRYPYMYGNWEKEEDYDL